MKRATPPTAGTPSGPPRRTPPRALQLLAGGTKCLVVGVLATTTIATASSSGEVGIAGADDDTTASAAVPSQQQERLARLMSDHRCSTTGFGPGVIPGSALVLRAERVRHVSFDEGWAVYTGDRPGTLLAVCRGDV